MVQGMMDGVGTALAALFAICVVSVPLGLWKLVEIVIWVLSHLRWEA